MSAAATCCCECQPHARNPNGSLRGAQGALVCSDTTLIERTSQAFTAKADAKVERTAASVRSLETQLLSMAAAVPTAEQLVGIAEAVCGVRELRESVPHHDETDPYGDY